MKTRLFLLCAAVLLSSAGASAQKKDLGRVPAKTVTLVSSAKLRDYKKSVFNFQHGVRGDKRFPGAPSVVSLKGLPDNRGLELRGFGGSAQDVHETSNPYRTQNDIVPGGRPDFHSPPRDATVRYDIRFGGLTVNGDNNWLEIAERRGTHSVLKDLGAMDWADVKSVPLLAPSPLPHTGMLTHRNRTVGPEEVIVRAVVGHMYVLRVKDRKTDYYVMFRVEAIDPVGACTLSWKRVPAPKS